MTSGSSRIAERLASMDAEVEFTSDLLAEDLGISLGSVTGFLAKTLKTGGIKVVRKEGRNFVYSVVDKSLMPSVRPTGRGGGTSGRILSRTQTESTQIAGLLRHLADRVEAHRSSLADFSTSDLIRELARRDRAEARRESKSEAE